MASMRELFSKNITRTISGVIKVQQEDDVKQELEEYIVTHDVRRKFTDFFNAYNKCIDGLSKENGVWISGFFGSGKSHLLKILAYLLANKIVDGKGTLDYIKDKIDDDILFSEMERAARQKPDVILFNIDAMADVGNGREDIVNVFKKAFDDMRGYYGFIPWIADMECSLDEKGYYISFQGKFKQLYGTSWIDARADIYFIGDEVKQALVECGAMSAAEADNWFANAQNNYRLNAISFADSVKKYIGSKGGKRQVAFMVDEIGQYIGDSSELMLKLQTVTEELGSRCNGQAWVIVTSQETLDTVLQRRITEANRNDFSKIQGRFKTRLALSSANAGEVIKKRLLEKKQSAVDSLRLYYAEIEAQLKNLLSFTSVGTQYKRLFQTADEFADVYPFVPYQFDLLHAVFQSIRESGAGGQHLAEGERSLLGAFHEVLQANADKGVGYIAPFSAFFDTMQEFLEHDVRIVIERAANIPVLNDHPLDIAVLKLLFMLKYVKGTPCSLDNLTTLMVTEVDTDKLQLQKDILGALNRLEGQILIQRNAETWEFLTNEEQQIAKEIERIPVGSDEMDKLISELIYSNILPESNVLLEGGYQYPFGKLVDSYEAAHSSGDIKLEIMTSNSDMNLDAANLSLRTSGKELQIYVVLGQPHDYINEISRIVKIDKFLRAPNRPQSAYNTLINENKGRERSTRISQARAYLERSILNADVWYNGQKLILNGNAAKARLQDGLRQVADNVYAKRTYVDRRYGSKAEIERQAVQTQDMIGGTVYNERAMDEMIEYLNLMEMANQQISLQKFIERFTGVRYGWEELDVAGVIVQLMQAEKFEVWFNGQLYAKPSPAVIDALTKRQERDRVTVRTRKRVDAGILQKVRTLMRDITGNMPAIANEQELFEHVKKKLQELQTDATNDRQRYAVQPRYPGKKAVGAMVEKLNALCVHNSAMGLFSQMDSEYEDIRTASEVFQRVHAFFMNQAVHFDKGLKLVKDFEGNSVFTSDKALHEVEASIKKIVLSDEPYSRMHEVPILNEQYEKRFLEILTQAKIPVSNSIHDDWFSVAGYIPKKLMSYKALAEMGIADQMVGIVDSKKPIVESLDAMDHAMQQMSENEKLAEAANAVMGVVRNFRQLVEALRTASGLGDVEALKAQSSHHRANAYSRIDNLPQESVPGESRPEPRPQRREQRIRLNELIRVGYKVENEEGVERLVNDIRTKLIEALRSGDSIRFE